MLISGDTGGVTSEGACLSAFDGQDSCPARYMELSCVNLQPELAVKTAVDTASVRKAVLQGKLAHNMQTMDCKLADVSDSARQEASDLPAVLLAGVRSAGVSSCSNLDFRRCP